jgi:hypothetical protein
MISMRYAWNLAHGNGIVWNPGERIEGYTNLLMVLFMAVPNLFLPKGLAVLAVQLFGVALVPANGYVLIQIAGMSPRAQQTPTRRLITILSYGGALAYYPLAYWSFMGMETGLVALLLSTATLWCLRYHQTGMPRYLSLMSLVSGLAALARPDTAVFSLLLYAFLLINHAPRRMPGRRAIPSCILAIAPAVLLPLSQLVFRSAYYGVLVPNTYTLKVVGMPLETRLANGINFLVPFMLSSGLVFCVAVIGCVPRPRKTNLLLLGVFVAAFGYQVWVGGDPWPYWRILAPTIPLLLIVFVEGVLYMFDGNAARSRGRVLGGTVIALSGVALGLSVLAVDNPVLTPGIGRLDTMMLMVAALVVIYGIAQYRLNALVAHRLRSTAHVGLLMAIAVVTLDASFLPEIVFRISPYQVDANSGNVRAALAISALTTDSASVGVFWAGAIPYYSGRHAIDFLGRSDAHIASLPPDLSGATGWYRMTSVPGHNKYDLNYSIIFLRPTYVQASEVGSVDVAWGGQDLTDWVARHYTRVCYEGAVLLLRSADPSVRWDRVPGACE